METNTDLKDKFLALSSWEDLAVFFLWYQATNKTSSPLRPLKRKDIASLLFVPQIKKYKQYQIKKKSGKDRNIDTPIANLKTIQKILLACIELCFEPKKAAHGFISEKSIVTNAKEHTKRRFVYNLDLENFFPSIHFGRIHGIFKGYPFQFSDEIARCLANLCCKENEGLPQGAPTSPILSNLVCRSLDGKLTQLAKKYKACYTRYADDITFSSNFNIFEQESFLQEIQTTIEGESFKINVSKTRLQHTKQRQVVTGLTVNKRVNVTPKYYNDLRVQIHLFSKDPSKAQQWLDENYLKQHPLRYNGNVPKIDRVIEGKLNFLAMVIGKDAPRYKTLYDKYEGEVKRIKEETKENNKREAEALKAQFDTWFGRLKGVTNETERYNLLIEVKTKISQSQAAHLKSVANEAQATFDKAIEQDTISTFLTRNLTANEIANPFALIDENILSIIKNSQLTPDKYTHNPLYLAEILSLFRRLSPLGALVHDYGQPYKEVVDNASEAFKKQSENNNGILSEEIPPSIYKPIKEFIKMLLADNRTKEYGSRSYWNFVEKNRDLINGFSHTYRFGNNNDGIKISDLIKYQFQSLEIAKEDIWSLKIPSDIGDTFSGILTSTVTIGNIIRKVIESCRKHQGIGAIEVEASKIAGNKVRLRIINRGVEAQNRTPEEFRRPLGGDVKYMMRVLKSYCDFNIITTFRNNQHVQIGILSELPQSVSYSKDDLLGFTYEFIFCKPLEILLIDDGKERSTKRIDKGNQIYRNNEEHFRDFFHRQETLNDLEELDSYNVILLHASNHDNERIKKAIEEKELPYITFSGGQLIDKKIREDYYELSDKILYDNLEKYLQTVKNQYKISFDFWGNIISKKEEDEQESTHYEQSLREDSGRDDDY